MKMSYGDWNVLGEVFYRKWHVYDTAWGPDINLDEYLICGAPFGGPIAMIRDDRKLVALSGDNAKPKLRIFTTAGQKIAEVIIFTILI